MNPLRQLNFDRNIRKAAIIHPGAIGDCVLTLPLAAFLKKTIGFHQVDLIGRTEYIGFYPARTAIDRVRSIESIPLHQLFSQPDDFIKNDHTRLIHTFAEYEHIISFLGTDNPSFEQNLLLAVHSSHSGEVTMLPMTPAGQTHAARLYMDEFSKHNPHLECDVPECTEDIYIRPLPTDMVMGMEILSGIGLSEPASIGLIHPGSGGVHKCWAVEKFIALAADLKANGGEPVFLFGPAEQERFSHTVKDNFRRAGHVLAGLDLQSVFQVLSCVDCAIGNDSGICHIAGAMGKKTRVIFGPTSPACYRPLGPNVTVIQADLRDFEPIDK